MTVFTLDLRRATLLAQEGMREPGIRVIDADKQHVASVLPDEEGFYPNAWKALSQVEASWGVVAMHRLYLNMRAAQTACGIPILSYYPNNHIALPVSGPALIDCTADDVPPVTCQECLAAMRRKS